MSKHFIQPCDLKNPYCTYHIHIKSLLKLHTQLSSGGRGEKLCYCIMLGQENRVCYQLLLKYILPLSFYPIRYHLIVGEPEIQKLEKSGRKVAEF